MKWKFPQKPTLLASSLNSPVYWIEWLEWNWMTGIKALHIPSVKDGLILMIEWSCNWKMKYNFSFLNFLINLWILNNDALCSSFLSITTMSFHWKIYCITPCLMRKIIDNKNIALTVLMDILSKNTFHHACQVLLQALRLDYIYIFSLKGPPQ